MNHLILSHLHKYTENNKYLKHYILLCEKAITRAVTKKEAQCKIGYVETHHIIPTSFDITLTNEIWNKVHLSAREHFVAHKLLIYAVNNEYKSKAKYAISKFIQSNKQQKRILSNRDYQFVREIMQESMVGSGNPRFGKSGTVTGRVCITDGYNNKFIKSNTKLPFGWSLGMTKPNIVITNGIDEARIKNESEIPDGWWVGSIRKGKTSKLKGRKLGKYSKARVDNQKVAIKKLKFSFYTDGMCDVKIPNGETIPYGFKKGRTHGGHHITDDMINRSLNAFNVSSLNELKAKLIYDIENGINTLSSIKRKYKKNKSVCKNNDPQILYFIEQFNLTQFIIKGKTGPKCL